MKKGKLNKKSYRLKSNNYCLVRTIEKIMVIPNSWFQI